jgi:hypothetical protein
MLEGMQVAVGRVAQYDRTLIRVIRTTCSSPIEGVLCVCVCICFNKGFEITSFALCYTRDTVALNFGTEQIAIDWMKYGRSAAGARRGHGRACAN